MRIVPIIDRHFHELMPPLSGEELAQLEKNLVAAGECTDPIAVWVQKTRDRGKGETIEETLLLDGENRLNICLEHGLPYKIQEIKLPDRRSALIWIIDNQLGRRNLNKAQRILLAQKKVGYLRPQARENLRTSGRRSAGARAPVINIRKEIAGIAGVAEQTVEYFMKVQEAAAPETLRQVIEGKTKIYTAFRNMTVVTSKVEDIITEEMAEEMNKPLLKGAILNNIGFIESAYRQTLENPPDGGFTEDDYRANDLLNKQSKALWKLTGGNRKRNK
jgi:hypothetical protein